MASKKAEAIARAKQKAEEKARWLRLEKLVLALADAAGINVDQVLEDSKDEVPELADEKEDEVEEAEEEDEAEDEDEDEEAKFEIPEGDEEED